MAQPNINLQDNVGRTALHLACKAGRLSILHLLCQNEEIDVNIRTCGGETPLMQAVLSGQKEAVIFCLENDKGFNPFLSNNLN